MRGVFVLFGLASALSALSCSSTSSNEAAASGGSAGSAATGGSGGKGGSGFGGAPSECNQAGYTCRTAPAGWSFVAFSETPEAECPADFAGPPKKALVGVTGASAACSCACQTVTAPSCSSGNVSWHRATTNDCAATGVPLANDGKCHGDEPTSGLLNGLHGKISAAPTPIQGSCTGQGKADSLSPVEVATDGRLCDPSLSCGGGGTCLPPLSGAFKTCVTQAGNVPCPGEFTVKTLAASGYDDNRSCTTCTCGTQAACAAPSVEFFADENCTPPAMASVTYICAPETQSYPQSWRVVAPVSNGECAPTSSSSATGSVVPNGERTICCEP